MPLRKRTKIILAGALSIVLCAYIAFTALLLLKLANEEYLYTNKKTFKKKLATLPSDINIENIRKIREDIDPSRFKFVVLGDSESRHDIFSRVIKDALRHKPDFILSVGDLTEQGKVRHYLREIEFIKKNIPVPFITVIGNHDHYNFGYLTFARVFGPLDFYFDIGGFRFICIDNNFKQKVKDIVELPRSDAGWKAIDGFDDEMLGRLEGLIAGGARSSLIFMHQPPPLDGLGDRGFRQNSEKFMELIRSEGSTVRYVCSGHAHGYAEYKIGDIEFIVTGGAGGRHRVVHNARLTHKYNYVLFEVNGNEIKDTVCFVETEEGQT